MDVTFISIHDMSQNARILYASDSIQDILGYQPHEVIHKPCWDYFHPEEMPFAQSVHGRGVQRDKAAVLRYCRIRHKQAFWVCCECVFSVVYNVLVALTIAERAVDAPIVRRMFASSPRDPRYHMLSYLSNKFTESLSTAAHEPRAALFLNRFSRTLPIMFATDGVAHILGLAPQQLVSKSFYFCIQERSLHDAVRCLESAKANNSIAYLQFWYRNPVEGNVVGNNSNTDGTESVLMIDANTAQDHQSPVEVEAVVSCTSDGLVVILRRARPSIPQQATLTSTSVRVNHSPGLFASPWAVQPILPPQTVWNSQGYPTYNFSATTTTTTTTTFLQSSNTLPNSNHSYNGGPNPQELFETIRDVAVFVWGIIGINGSLEQYRKGQPSGDAIPDGIDLWDPKVKEEEGGSKDGS
ncbi:hypothetical protein UA08_07585 [Talaromyces atroroseus]|uniref:PAS domain-containing protein n=1 Tax=Talaromyces atroroseus TaxID=1441469 RepID=A0A225ANV2_TALAT|nr:hypothetical protein UA08_07585 [Talaromyces atroroseus]OKL57269.1 hypothetical protein UA08_07585 [Talaromyces atroroseus]